MSKQNFPSIYEQMDLIRRGAVEIIPEEELVLKLERSIKEEILQKEILKETRKEELNTNTVWMNE